MSHDDAPPKFEIVQMTAGDVPDVLRIANETGLAPWSEDDYLEELKRSDSIALVLKIDKSSIARGFAVMRLITINNSISISSSIDLLNIAIAKGHKRKRLGSTLLLETIRIAKTTAPTTIWLEVRCSNEAAIAFYKKHGFEPVQRRKKLYSAPPEDGWLMKLDLQGTINT
ncbi:MAG TPA: GNAT family N-acetyltransferase [Pyrinomonadaceae bacterium]|nr:GNAT family N-acetyltransferase [Pyrinomonadaceae bacterium]